MFQGVVGINLDAKGRLAIPTKHRDSLLSDSEKKVSAYFAPSSMPSVVSFRVLGAHQSSNHVFF